MDLSKSEDEGEAEFHVVEQRVEVIRCYTCGISKHLRPTCPLFKQRMTHMGRNFVPNQKPGITRGNVDIQ